MVTMSHRVDQDVDHVRLVGRFVAADSATISDGLHRILEDGNKNVSLDLAELDFMDSSALGVLVSSLKHARKDGGDVVLRNVNPRIMSLLKLTRLHEIFEVHEDLADSDRLSA